MFVLYEVCVFMCLCGMVYVCVGCVWCDTWCGVSGVVCACLCGVVCVWCVSVFLCGVCVVYLVCVLYVVCCVVRIV